MFRLRMRRLLTSTTIQLLMLATFCTAFALRPAAHTAPVGMPLVARAVAPTLSAVAPPEPATPNREEMTSRQANVIIDESLPVFGVVDLAVIVAWFSVWLIHRSSTEETSDDRGPKAA
jgi:hypothetical protein